MVVTAAARKQDDVNRVSRWSSYLHQGEAEGAASAAAMRAAVAGKNCWKECV
jgi:hypothetical protein